MSLGSEKREVLGQFEADSGGPYETEIVVSDPSGEEEANAPDVEITECIEDTPQSETAPVQDAVDLPDESGEKNSEGEISELADKLQAVSDELKKCTEAQRDLEAKTVQTLRENANFQIQVRQNMQRELEEAKKKLSGAVFIPLLKEIAELYIERQDVLDDMEEGVAKRKVEGIFDILKDILEENGCEFGTSEIGTKRNPRYSKLKKKVPVNEKERHETVAKSHNPWIAREPFMLYPEKVDVCVYDPALASGEPEEDRNVGSKEETE